MVELQSRKGTARMRRKVGRPRNGFVLFGTCVCLALAMYIFLITKVAEQHDRRSGAALISPANLTAGDQVVVVPGEAHRPPLANGFGSSKRSTYQDWKELAVELAELPADEILVVLKTQDPFGVRRFEERLLQTESDRQAILQLDDIKQLFPCPTDERITLPDQRNHELARKYREGLHQLKQPKDEFVFLFFQHLRKAGGTNFCGLAERNLLKPQVPQYYCMPDYHWDNVRKCAGCLNPYSNEDIASRMAEAGHRVLGNEWENFAPRFFDLPAVFATSFRRPLDRALSQFRFECIEDRGCKFKEVEPWWKRRTDLTNVYLWTFAQVPVRRISIGKTKKDAQDRQNAMEKALDTVARFNLVLAMEWLAYAAEHTRDVLGFKDTSTMTERIRPHINQAVREDGQEHNQLGAAGIAKASWTPEAYLSREQYKIMSEDLALDEILTDAARRMFLERIVCDDMSEETFLS
jgi:PHD/YefM family antitoxin component YafN of YafNO toxin-antitoxin module